MELQLTAEQELLLASARAWVARACPIERARELDAAGTDAAAEWMDLWREMTALDWVLLALPAEAGGSGAGLLELALVAEALGEGAVPTPLLTSVTLAARPLHRSGARPDLVAALGAGELIGSLALLEPGMRDEWSAVRMSGVAPLHGAKLCVPWAHAADVLVVATVDGLRLVECPAPGLHVTRHDALGGDPLGAVELDGVAAAPAGDAGILPRVLAETAVVQLAYAVGIMRTMLDLSVRHAQERRQFGRPIGAFQAVAHRCAEMRADVDAGRFLAYQAAWALDHDDDAGEARVAAALAYTKDAARRVARHAHQVHGAAGFSTEHDLHLFSRRAKAFELTWGGATLHREHLAGAMGLR
jgi:alkylation response protein AidB-like acyl-CoA dehydrogenase